MPACVIRAIQSVDHRFKLSGGAGSDAVHSAPEYSYATTILKVGGRIKGIGLALTLGNGNDVVCTLIDQLATVLVGREIEELMADFGQTYRQIANHHQYRWLGPYKGAVHLALASITNACFDLWAKARGVPLWRLLLDLPPKALIATLDLSYLDEILPAREALSLLQTANPTRTQRMGILDTGYPGYDTSVGWFNYSNEEIRDNVKRALDQGFTAMKLKAGSRQARRDIERACLVRETAGHAATIMLDANQQWTYPQALVIGRELKDIDLYWIEEPTHPDDLLAHKRLAEELAPVKIAAGEHIPNAVMFKNFMQAQAAHFIQVDCTRVGGVSEFLVVSLLAKKLGLPVVPHVGDMGQIHQHLVLFNHIALAHDPVFLEYIPHLRDRFREPAIVEAGRYQTPQLPGASTQLS